MGRVRKIACVFTHAIWTVLLNNVCFIYFFWRMRKSHAIIRSKKIATHPIWMYPNLRTLDTPLYNAMAKIFKSFDHNTLNWCMFYILMFCHCGSLILKARSIFYRKCLKLKTMWLFIFSTNLGGMNSIKFVIILTSIGIIVTNSPWPNILFQIAYINLV